MRVITFLSDFGNNSWYVSQMKGVALSLTNATLVDITHEISPHNIREGAYVLLCSVPYFPSGSVHVAVVDPGVGTNRRNIFITTRSQILIGPDNGLLIPAARFLGDFTVYEIADNSNHMQKTISNTFHGRDIYTPVAARIVNGLPFDAIGKKISDYVDLDFGSPVISDKCITGRVMYIDRFGNIITNIPGFIFNKHVTYGNLVMTCFKSSSTEMRFVKSYGFVKPGEFLITIGSGNYVEISINQGNAARSLSVSVDDEIRLLF
ncbi:MAG: S-adenosyl-l-methionine hydroxide adenosyltransferase family protein [Candidatus Thermoplasmatota archaeon]